MFSHHRTFLNLCFFGAPSTQRGFRDLNDTFRAAVPVNGKSRKSLLSTQMSWLFQSPADDPIHPLGTTGSYC
jgi:hypothetical protein